MNIFDFDFSPKTMFYSFSDSFFKIIKNLLRFRLFATRAQFCDIRLPRFDQKLDGFQNPAKTVMGSSNESPSGTEIAQNRGQIWTQHAFILTKSLLDESSLCTTQDRRGNLRVSKFVQCCSQFSQFQSSFLQLFFCRHRDYRGIYFTA